MWILQEKESHEIISCNVHQQGELYQLWVTRPNDKSLKIMESENKDEVVTMKKAVDYAIEHGECAFNLA